MRTSAHIAEEDTFDPVEQAQAMADAMQQRPGRDVYVHPGVGIVLEEDRRSLQPEQPVNRQ